MMAKITNNTSYDIILVDGTTIERYSTKTVKIDNDVLKEQIINLRKNEIITVSFIY